jgi:drug/metabolite transporter (DMT)-like permease
VGSRFFIAGCILGLFYLKPKHRPTWKEVRNAAAIGTLILGVGTGAIVFALQYVDTGLSALVVAFEPLIVVVLMWIILKQRPTWMTLIGLLLGIIGMIVLITQEAIVTNQDTLFGISIISISLVAWAFGSIYLGMITLPKSKGLSASIQMIGSGLALMIVSVLVGEDQLMFLHKFHLKAMACWFILVFFGSIIAYSSFNYLLIKSSPDKVATTTYVNPVVAILLGWSLNNEIISHQSLLAAVILLSGVIFINSSRYK